MATIIVVSAPLLEVRPEGRVGVRGLSWLVLPPSCFAREALGVECPGCGLTRSFVHLAHGDWVSSLQCHRVGWILMLAVLLQFPYRLHALGHPGQSLVSPRTAGRIGSVLIALLIGNWLVGFAIPWIIRACPS